MSISKLSTQDVCKLIYQGNGVQPTFSFSWSGTATITLTNGKKKFSDSLANLEIKAAQLYLNLSQSQNLRSYVESICFLEKVCEWQGRSEQAFLQQTVIFQIFYRFIQKYIPAFFPPVPPTELQFWKNTGRLSIPDPVLQELNSNPQEQYVKEGWGKTQIMKLYHIKAYGSQELS